MPRIIIAGATEASRAQLNRLLTTSGFAPFRVCTSGGELRRALTASGDGLVVLMGTIPDCLPDDLAADFGDAFRLLLIARPEVLAACESPRVFKLASPCPGSTVIGALEMLSQLLRMRLPRRTGEDRALVERAKRVLMREQGISEPEAHRWMQKYAMQHGVKMTEYAARLLEGKDDHA